MSRRQGTLLFIALGATGACAPSLAGKIGADHGDLVIDQHAKVNVSCLTCSPLIDTSTIIAPVDAHGHYEVRAHLQDGDYLIEALVPGYRPVSRRMHIAASAVANFTLVRVSHAARLKATPLNPDVNEAPGSGGVSLAPPNL